VCIGLGWRDVRSWSASDDVVENAERPACLCLALVDLLID
jgi:hypothetical protein